MSETAPTDGAAAPDPLMGPGGRSAVERGCLCSVLANAAHRAGQVGEEPFVDPSCPVHADDVRPT